MKRNIFFWILISVVVLTSCKKDEPVPMAYVNLTYVNIDASYGKCRISCNIEATATVSNFVLELSSDSMFAECRQIGMSQKGKRYEALVNGLINAHTYYIRCRAINECSSCLSASLTFSTKSNQKPIVRTDSITNISYVSAIANATLLDWGSETLPNVGFCIAKHSNVTVDDKCIECALSGMDDIIAYSTTLNSLEDNTTYYVRAYATNSQGTAYGEEKSFATYNLNQIITYTASSKLKETTDAGSSGLRANAFGNVSIVSHTFNNGEGTIIFNGEVTSIGEFAFKECYSLNSVTIPNSVTSIGYGAFSGCSGLTSVTIPNSVTSIGESVFFYCTSLTSVTIPNSVTSIGKRAFFYCSSLTSVTIPNSVTSIGYGAFYNCSGLTSIDIPNSVTNIGHDAFSSCTSLTSITCKATTPPTCGSSTFSEVSKSIPVYVPSASVSKYKSADVWKDFTNIKGL